MVSKRLMPVKTRSNAKKAESKTVTIVHKPPEAMIGQLIEIELPPLELSDPYCLVREGVDRQGGSLFHCILRAVYPPYQEWSRERRLRKVREFRQSLAANFDGYYLRIDQNGSWPSLSSCKKELEIVDGPLPYEYCDYIGKAVNKSIMIVTFDSNGELKAIPGTKVYAPVTNRTNSSPISPNRAEPMFILLLHLGGPAYEVVTLKRESQLYTLFPESHILVQTLGATLSQPLEPLIASSA